MSGKVRTGIVREQPRSLAKTAIGYSLAEQKFTRGRPRRPGPEIDRGDEIARRATPRSSTNFNRGRAAKLTAINIGSTIQILDNWGLKGMARSGAKSIEEMEHADAFTARILFLEGFPNMQVLDPLRQRETVEEVLQADFAAELGAAPLSGEPPPICEGGQRTSSRAISS